MAPVITLQRCREKAAEVVKERHCLPFFSVSLFSSRGRKADRRAKRHTKKEGKEKQRVTPKFSTSDLFLWQPELLSRLLLILVHSYNI